MRGAPGQQAILIIILLEVIVKEDCPFYHEAKGRLKDWVIQVHSLRLASVVYRPDAYSPDEGFTTGLVALDRALQKVRTFIR